MAYSTLKAAIQAVIKQNGNNEITGPILQQALLSMINSLGDGYQFKGVATPATNPGTPDQNVFYIASEVGTYSNFGLSVGENEVAVFLWNGSWSKQSTGAVSAEAVNQLGQKIDNFTSEYNVSANNNNDEYTFAQAVALVPTSLQKGGLTIKYIDSTTHEYAIKRLMSSTWNATESNWQGIDDEPTAGSDNLVKSGGITNVYGSYTENPEYIEVHVDSDNKILYGVKSDGDFYFGAGVPGQIKEKLNEKVDKVSGKQLSTEDYTTSEKEKLSALPTATELSNSFNEKVDKEVGKTLIDSEIALAYSIVKNPEYVEVKIDSDGKILEGTKYDGTKIIGGDLEVKGIIKGLINKIQEQIGLEFSNKSTLDKFGEINDTLLWNGSPIEGGAISTLVVDLPVSDGTDIQSGYAYIDSVDRTIKVKA